MRPWQKRTILLLAFLALVPALYAALGRIFSYLPIAPGENSSANENTAAVGEAYYGNPIRILIPKIKVDSKVEPVGLTRDGAMDAPRVPMETGWYDHGPRPGETGSAVIDGHRGWHGGIPASFDNLYKLVPGDEVDIETLDGKTLTFKVRETHVYDNKADVPGVWNKNDGKYLNLITCSGDFDKIAGTSKNRLVVYTDFQG